MSKKVFDLFFGKQERESSRRRAHTPNQTPSATQHPGLSSDRLEIIDDFVRWLIDNWPSPAPDEHSDRCVRLTPDPILEKATKNLRSEVSDADVEVIENGEGSDRSPEQVLVFNWSQGAPLPMDILEFKTAILAAAAALAAAYVLWKLRRGESIRGFRPSAEYFALAGLEADGPSEARPIAKRVLDRVASPTKWSLSGADLTGISDAEKRILLLELHKLEIERLSIYQPAAGDPYDANVMEAKVSDAAKWVVAEDVAPSHAALYLRTDSGVCNLMVRALVQVQTLDWWLISKGESPVAKFIAARGADLTDLPNTQVGRWHADTGFVNASLLRGSFDERTLEEWRTDILRRYQEAYGDDTSHRLKAVGQPGDPYRLSSMDAENDVRGEAEVVEVVVRDGIPQRGLCVEGGLAILPAIVRVEPVSGAVDDPD
jgi:hypothetical protein